MQKVVDGIITSYEILGKNNINTILILHGWGRYKEDWLSVGKNLSTKYKVILLDLPGHGATIAPPFQPFDTYNFADFVISFLNKIGINKTLLLGHSFGGKIATVIASRSGMVSKLVLVDASGIDERNRLTKLQISFYKKSKIFIRILPKSVFRYLHDRIYKQAGDLVPSFKKIVIQNVSGYAKNINIPTLIIWGENDKEVTTDQAKRFRQLIPNSTLRIVWGASHHPHLEKSEKFLNLLNEYI